MHQPGSSAALVSALFPPQIYNLAFDVTLQEERTLRILRQTSPGTRYVRLAPPTGYIALTEHRDKARRTMPSGALAACLRAFVFLRCFCAVFAFPMVVMCGMHSE